MTSSAMAPAAKPVTTKTASKASTDIFLKTYTS
jgi:hypothetical protein